MTFLILSIFWREIWELGQLVGHLKKSVLLTV